MVTNLFVFKIVLLCYCNQLWFHYLFNWKWIDYDYFQQVIVWLFRTRCEHVWNCISKAPWSSNHLCTHKKRLTFIFMLEAFEQITDLRRYVFIFAIPLGRILHSITRAQIKCVKDGLIFREILADFFTVGFQSFMCADYCTRVVPCYRWCFLVILFRCSVPTDCELFAFLYGSTQNYD